MHRYLMLSVLSPRRVRNQNLRIFNNKGSPSPREDFFGVVENQSNFASNKSISTLNASDVGANKGKQSLDSLISGQCLTFDEVSVYMEISQIELEKLIKKGGGQERYVTFY